MAKEKSQPQPLEKVLAMKGGNGHSSYAHNSLSVQKNIIQAVKPIVERAVLENTKLDLSIGGRGRSVFRIADFGCATGTNTLLVADTIVTALQCISTRLQIKNESSICEDEVDMEAKELPEVEVYFSDLPSNDFNSLLRMLPPTRLAEEAEKTVHRDDNPLATRSYFAAAVAGSHFKRLFPRQSLHFCHSSLSLHWLSRVPEDVEDRSCAAWSGSRVYVSSEGSEAVGAAYLQQFENDLTSFLRARGEEIIPGGCMLLALVGRKPGAQNLKEQGTLGDIARHFEFAFDDLVNEGVIEKEKWESFNMPWFGPNPEEMESIVEREKSFAIKSVRVLGGFPLHPMTEVRGGEEDMFGRIVENHYRALFENIVAAHLGCERLTDQFFSRIAKRAAANFPDYLPNTIDVLVALLIRKQEKSFTPAVTYS